MTPYSIEPRTRKYIKGYGYLLFPRNLLNKYGKNLLCTATKRGLDAANTASKIVVEKTTEVIDKMIGDSERVRNTRRVKTSIIKMKHHKISKLLNVSTLPKFLIRKRIEVNDLLSGQHSANKKIRFKTPMLSSDLCDYSDAYIIV